MASPQPSPLALVPSAASLESNHPLFWAMIGAMQDAVLVLTANHEVLVANLAFRQRFPKIGQPSRTLIPDDHFWNQVTAAFADGVPKSVALQYHPTPDSERSYHVELIPLTDTQSTRAEEPLCICVFNDYTTIRRTEKMRRDFVANVSHELRTPLSAIHGYAETLLDGALHDPELAQEFVGIMFRHSARLSQLVADLLDLSKLESPDFTLELAPLNLVPLVRSVISMVEQAASTKGLIIGLELPDNLPPVMAHDSTLEQVVTNLLDNAIKYTPPGGEISVRLTQPSSTVLQVDIADTGMGIPQKHLSRLFERFYRVDKSRSREMGGTGLGLSIVKHIIQSHGGNIWVESDVGPGPNQGTTFSFTLNVATPAG